MNGSPDSGTAGASAPELFISYAREDRDTAQQLAQALHAAGWSVWWDREIRGGTDFTEVIACNLANCRLALVLWSEAAVRSAFVRDESARARDAGKLLPLRIEAVDPPLGFGQIQTLDLIDWDDDPQAPAFRAVADEIRHALGQGGVPPPQTVPRRWRWRRLAWGVAAALLLATGFGAYRWQQAAEAERQMQAREARAERFFQDGVAAQFGREPNLESARNDYLSALELRPRHARTHYYLGHVYAQLQLRDGARGSFFQAVALAGGLDAGQIQDARRQLALLTTADEPAPVARAVPAVQAEAAPPAPAPAAALPQESAQAPRMATQASPSAPSGLASAGAGRGAIAGAAQTASSQEVLRAARLSTSAAMTQASAPTALLVLARRPGELRGGLPHVAPDDALLARVEPLVAQMFAPEREQRVVATTSLILDLALTSDAAPLAVAAALKLQRAMPADPAALATARSGVINTLTLLRAASPVTLRKSADAIRALLALARGNGPQTVELVGEVETRLQAALRQRPVTWIQIADEAQRPLAQRLQRHLQAFGYDAPGIENLGARAPAGQAEIRTQGDSDQGLTRWQARVMTDLGLAPPRLSVLRQASPKVDSYEIWLDRETCVSRRLPACG